LGFGQRKGLERSREEAGRESVVLARGVEDDESPLLACADGDEFDRLGDAVKYDAPDVGDGRREESGVVIGVLSALWYRSAGGTQLDGLEGSLLACT